MMKTARDLMQTAGAKLASRREEALAMGAVYKLVLEGEGGGTWVMDLKERGSITEGDGGAQCTITMSAADYVELLEGRSSGQQLFMTGRLRVEGDVALALKLEALTDMLR